MAKLTLVLSYDTETFMVALGGDSLTVGLGQMMCDEALRQLDEQRRRALVQQLQTQAREDAIRAAIVAKAKTREV